MPSDAEAAAARHLLAKVSAVVEHALDTGFKFAFCDIELRSPALPITLRFSNNQGSHYAQRLGWMQVYERHGATGTLDDAELLKARVEAAILKAPGIEREVSIGKRIPKPKVKR